MSSDVRFGEIKIHKIPIDEPVFILRASDAASVKALRVYGELAEDLGDLKEAEDAALARRRFVSFRIGRGL